MLKRLLFIGLCLCLVALMTTDADARCRVVDGHWKCSDLCPVTEGTGAGNVDKNTVAVCVSYAIVAGDGTDCFNQPWNSSEPANDVFSNPSIAGIAHVTSLNLTGERGNFVVDDEELCLSWPGDIWPAMAADACPNENWHYVRLVPYGDADLDLEANCPGGDNFGDCYCEPVDPNNLALGYWCPGRFTEMYSYHVAYQENKQGELDPVSALCVRCYYDESSDVCDNWGNPISCEVQANTTECTNRHLDEICETEMQIQ